jgi:hypothetical protein
MRKTLPAWRGPKMPLECAVARQEGNWLQMGIAADLAPLTRPTIWIAKHHERLYGNPAGSSNRGFELVDQLS